MIDDITGEDVVPITNSKALQATAIIRDETPPSLIEYALLIDTGILELTFNDVIDVTSFDITGFTLHRNADGSGAQFTFTNSSLASRLSPGTIIRVDVSEDDLNGIQSNLKLSIDIDTTYISVTAGAVYDSFNNEMPPILSTEPLPSTTLVPDTSVPSLVSFILDLNQALLRLSFTEAIDIDLTDPTGLTLQSTDDRRDANAVLITLSSAVLPSTSGAAIGFGLTNDDFGRIISNPFIGTSTNDTFIAMAARAFADTSGNPVIVISGTDALQAVAVLPDETSPMLSSFDVNIGEGIVVLRFSEAVNLSSVILNELQLQSTPDQAFDNATILQLTNPELSLTDTRTILVSLSVEDANFLRESSEIATSSNDIYLSIGANFITDYFENPIAPIPTNSAMPVSEFTPDLTSPRILAVMLDLEEGRLVVTFDERVNETSINITRILLQNLETYDSTVSVYSLTSTSSFILTNDTVLDVLLSTDDLNGIKGTSGIGFLNTTFVNITRGALIDQFGNQFTEQSYPIENIAQDMNRPELLGFSFDVNMGQLLLTFNETVDAESLQPTFITLQSNVPSPVAAYSLTGGSIGLLPNSLVLTIQLSSFDETQLRLMTDLAESINDTILSIMEGAVADVAGNPMFAVVGVMADDVFVDLTRPELYAFSLDFNTNTLALTFTKSINISTFSAPLITIQSSRFSDNVSLTLSDGIYDVENTRSLLLQLSSDDIVSLHAEILLAVSRETTFLSIPGGQIFDLRDMNVTEIPINNALQVSSLTEDTTPPTISSFDINLLNNTLTLQFSEPVMSSSFTPGYLTLLNSSSSVSPVNFTLSPANFSVLAPDTLQVNLLVSDVNEINLNTALCANRASCYITALDNLTVDISGNVYLAAADDSDVVQVNEYVRDQIRPYLIQVVRYDLNTGTISLQFSEPISRASIDLTQLTLQAWWDISLGLTSLTLSSDGRAVVGDTFVNITLAQSDFDIIKSDDRLCTASAFTCWVVFTEDFARDLTDNRVLAAQPSSAGDTNYFPSMVITDSTGPIVNDLHVDLDNGIITLEFNEVINPSTFTPTALTFRRGLNSNITYTLMSATRLTNARSSMLQFRLTDVAVNALKSLGIGLDRNNTAITFTEDLVQDIAEQSVQEETNGILATTVTEDQIRPSVVEFLSLDFNSHTLSIEFSEPIELPSFEASGFTIHSLNDPSMGLSQVLESTNISVSSNPTVYTIYLTREDVVFLRTTEGIATTTADTFLSVSANSVRDLTGNQLLPTTAALQLQLLVTDSTRPSFEGFTLDLNTGLLNLTFDDVMSAASFRGPSFRFRNDSIILFATQSYSLTSTTVPTTNDGFDVTVQISEMDLNAIKARSNVGRTINDTFLELANDAIQDIAAEFVYPSILQADDVIPDTTSPTIRTFSVDLDEGQLILAFDEVVEVNSLNVTSLTLQNRNNNNSLSFTLTGGDIQPNSTVSNQIIITLLMDNLNTITRLQDLATSVTNSFLSASYGFVVDTSDNLAAMIPSEAPEPASQFNLDMTPPLLTDVQLDLNNGLLVLEFSETVNSTSLNASGVLFQNSPVTPDAMYLLSSGNITTTSLIEGDHILYVRLTEDDLNGLKAQLNLATEPSNTFVSILDGSIADASGVPITNSPPIRASAVFNDTTQPELITFVLNLTSNLLTLSFSETVLSYTLDTTFVTLSFLNDSNHTLSPMSTIIPGISPVLTVNLSEYDTNTIKSAFFDTTYISTLSGAVSDASNLPSTPSSNVSGVVISDAIQPSLVCYALNLTSGMLSLTFDSPVDPLILNVSGIMVLSAPNSTNSHTLQSSFTTSPRGTVMIIELAPEDLNFIKLDTILATSENNTCLTIASFTIQSTSGLPVMEYISETDCFRPCEFETDMKRPSIVDFTVLLTNNRLPLVLTLIFDEAVNASTVDPFQVTLQTARNISEADQFYTLTGGAVQMENSNTIAINITEIDFSNIRFRAPLIEDLNETFLSITDDAFRDMNNNEGLRISNSSALQAGEIPPRLETPILTTFDLDLNEGTLTLSYTDSVYVDTLQASYITLQSSQSSPNASYTLQSEDAIQVDSKSVRILLSDVDLNVLKFDVNLATSSDNTWLSAESGAIRGNGDNPSNLVPVDNARQVDLFTPDYTRPELIGYCVYINSSLLVLTFSESVRISTLESQQLTLQNQRDSPDVTYTLSEGAPSTLINLVTVMLTLGEADIDTVTSMTNLFTSVDDTFITATAQLIEDTSGNALVPIRSGLGTICFISDDNQPYLSDFDYNAANDELVLVFNETVNISTLMTIDITLLEGRSNMTTVVNYTLMSSSPIGESGPTIRVQLSLDDAATIKSLRLCRNSSFCYLSHSKDLVEDIVGMEVIAQPIEEALRARSVIPDNVLPRLTGFQINLNASSMTLYFSEAVMLNSLNLTALCLQSFYYQPYRRICLTGYDILLTVEDGYVVSFTLTKEDLVRIQASTDVCSTHGSCYLITGSNLIADVYDNQLQPITDTTPALLASEFIPDEVRPELLNFTLNLNDDLLVLTFSEAVDVSTLNVMALTLQSRSNSSDNETMSYSLQSSSSSSGNGDVVVIKLSPVDRDAIKSLPFGTDANDTYIFITENLIFDTALNMPNQVSPIPSSDGLRASEVITDSKPPYIAAYTLDLNNGTLILSFSEPVLYDTFNVTDVTLSSSTVGDVSLMLTNTVVIMNEGRLGDSVITIALDPSDLAVLKLNRSLATSTMNTYLSTSSGIAADTSGNMANPTINLVATVFIPDTTRATLMTFTFDTNTGELNLTFTDVIQITTFDFSAFDFQGNPLIDENGLRYSLSQATNFTTYDDYTVVVYLDPLELVRVKSVERLATSLNNTFMTMRADAIDDHRFEDVLAVTNGRAVQASLVIEDTTPPELSQFILDMDEGILYLTFSDSVRIDTFNVTGITLQATPIEATANNSFTLTNGTLSRSADNPAVIELSLTEEDLNEIKRNELLAISTSTTALSALNETAEDIARNQLIGIPSNMALPTGTSGFIADTTGPVLRSYILDLNSSRLILDFDETINVRSYSTFSISLQNAAITAETTSNYTIRGVVLGDQNGPTVTLGLLATDSDSIKCILDLGTSTGNTFLTISSLAFEDMNSRPVQAILTEEAQPASEVIPDEVKPSLRSFHLDLNSRTLVFTFTECTKLDLLSEGQLQYISNTNDTMPCEVVQLTGGTPIYDLNLATLPLVSADLFAIQRCSNLGVHHSNTYFSASEDFASDTSNNKLIAIPSTGAQPASRIISDTTAPLLENFQLDLDAPQLHLTFDEVINVSFISPSLISLTDTSGNASVSLSSSVVASETDYIITINITIDDKEAIDIEMGVATSQLDTFIQLAEAAVFDVSSNPVNASSQPFPGVLIRDQSGPMLESFNLSLDSAQLALQFNEAVNTSTLKINLIEIVASIDIFASRFALEYTTLPADLSPRSLVVLDLHLRDLNALKADVNLATNGSSTFIRYEYDTVRDVYRNPAPEINVPIPASFFENDRSGPRLENFDLDLDNGVLTLSFSETVDEASFDPTKITIISTPNSTNNSVTLSDYQNFRISDFSVVILELTEYDLNSIKANQELAVSNTTTYLSIAEDLVQDNVENPSFPILPEEAPIVDNYTADTTDVELRMTYLDLNTNVLTLLFSEPVNMATFNLSQIVLFDPSDPSVQFTIQNAILPMINTEVWRIALSQEDTNQLNALPICRDFSSCYINFTDSLVSDTVGNGFNVPPNILLQVDNYTVDSTMPSLVEFEILNFNSGQLVMLFSETVDVSNLSPTAGNLTNWHEDVILRSTIVPLTGGYPNSTNGPRLVLQLSEDDLNTLKTEYDVNSLCRGRADCWIRLGGGFITDAAGNPLVPVMDGPYRDTEFSTVILDTTPPELTAFRINLDSNILVLTFSEVVNPSAITSALTFLSDEEGTFNVSLIGDSTSLTTEISNEIEIQIGPQDQIVLKSSLDIATSLSTTWLSISRDLIMDVFDVQVAARDANMSALNASEYVMDQTRPTVVEFKELSLADNTITIVFNEPVYLPSYTPGLFRVQIEMSGGTNYTLTGGNAVYGDTTLELVIQLSNQDVAALKIDLELAVDQSSTYLFVDDTAIDDTSGNPVISTGNGINVRLYIPDRLAPLLLSFNLDMNIGLLQLTFNDVIIPTSFMPSQVTLQNASNINDAETFTFTRGSSNTSVGFSLDYYIPLPDLNDIKAIPTLATNMNDTYLTVTQLAVLDPEGQGPSGTSVVGPQVARFIYDETNPELREFVLDISGNDGILSMLFSETVNSSSLNPTGITLVNRMSSYTQSHTLTGGTLVSSQPSASLMLNLTVNDLNSIKERLDLGTSVSNTFIAVENFTVADMSDNYIVPINSNDARPAVSHSVDITSPTLQRFELDLNEGEIIFYFSESVNISSLNPSYFTVISQPMAPYANHTLTGGRATVNDTMVSMHDAVVRLMLTEFDLDTLKQMTDLGTTESNTWLIFQEGAVADSASNVIAEISNLDAYPATNVYPDTTQPTLLTFSVDLHDDTLSLTFSETVNSASLNFTGITILNGPNGTLFYQLTNGDIVSTIRNITTISFALDDLNTIKVLTGLMTSTDNSWISIQNFTIADLSNNYITEVNFTDPVQATSFISDDIRPELVDSDFDLNNGTLTLYFSESVDNDTLDASQITFSDGQLGIINYTLTGGSTQSGDGPVIVVDLTTFDLDILKGTPGLADAEDTTFISNTELLIDDMNGNDVEDLNITFSKAVLSFTPDTTSPYVVAFNLSMSEGNTRPMLLTVQFSETINLMSVDVTGFTLQSDKSGTSRRTLTGDTPMLLYHNLLQIEVNDNDFEYIRDGAMFLQSENDSYLTVSEGSVNDSSGNRLRPLLSGIQVSTFAADLAAPELVYSTLDMNTGLIRLKWSEDLILESVRPTYITLQNALVTFISHTLRGNNNVTYGDTMDEVIVYLTPDDFNIVTANIDLATSINDTFIQLRAGTVQDTARNPSNQLTAQISNYIRDRQRPTLVSFSFVLTTGVLSLTFDESVDKDTIDITGITLQNAERKPEYSLTLSGGSTTADLGPLVEWTLSTPDLNYLKSHSELFTDTSDSYLAIAHFTIQDLSGNAVFTIPPSMALMATSVGNDTIPPRLDGFSIDLCDQIVILSFAETVNVSTLNVSELTLYGSNMDPSVNHRLSSSSSSDPNQATIVVSLSAVDFNEISRLMAYGLCTSSTTCRLSLGVDAVQDMSRLSNDAVLQNESQPALDYIPDCYPPDVLELANFNLSSATLTLIFNETVNVSSLNVQALTLQSLYDVDPLANYTLNDSQPLTSDGTVLEIQLSTRDLIQIQILEELCDGQGSCYITYTAGLIMDMAGNPVIPQLPGDAPGLIALEFAPDYNPPQLLSFTFDANTGTFVLTFTEAIDVRSIDLTAVYLQGQYNTSDRYRLTGGTPSEDVSEVISFTLNQNDLFNIQSMPYFKTVTDSFISLEPNAFRDVAFQPNAVHAISSEMALLVSEYFNDTLSPNITGYTLDLNSDILTLTFSEVVLLSSFDASAIFFTTIGNISENINLDGGVVAISPENRFLGSDIVSISITNPDITELKTTSVIGQTEEMTCLGATGGIAADTTNNLVEAQEPLCNGRIVEDVTPLELSSFDLDIDIGELTLSFNDVALSGTLDSTAFYIQDASEASVEFQFSDSSFTNSADGHVIVVNISPVDLFRLKSTDGLANTANDTYLRMRADGIDDSRVVDVLAITDSKAIPVSQFVDDTTPPSFSAFDLNMDMATLTLYFTEAIRLSSLQISNLTLYSTPDTASAPNNFTLTEGDLTQSLAGDIITIQLSFDDMNALKADLQLAISNLTTFLEIPDGVAEDLRDHLLNGTPEGYAEMVSIYTPDSTPPMLMSYAIDIESGLILLTFSETINSSSVSAETFALQNRRSRSSITMVYQLTDSTVSDEDSPFVTIYLSPNDLNSIKLSRQLAIDMHTTFLLSAIPSTSDTAGNLLVPISERAALQASNYTGDTSSPELVDFTFDRNEGVFTLTFTEVIELQPIFKSTEITIQSGPNSNSSLTHTLQYDGEIYPAYEDFMPVYNLTPSLQDLHNIKRPIGLAYNISSTFISLTNDTTKDYVGRAVAAILSDNATQAINVILDTTPPGYVSFILNMNRHYLLITFNDVIDASTVIVEQIQLVGGTMLNENNTYNLSSFSNITQVNDLEIEVLIHDDDINEIKKNILVASNNQTSYIYLTFDTLRDTSGNPNLEFNSPRKVDRFFYDLTRPELLEFNISIDGGFMIMLFSETMNASSLMSQLLQFQSMANLTSLSLPLNLTQASMTTSADGIVLNVTIGLADLNALKDRIDLATNVNDTFLSFSHLALADMGRNYIIERTTSDALPVTEVIPDVTNPTLDQFVLNLENATLTLYFSETVDINTFNVTEIALQNATDDDTTSFAISASSNFTRTEFSVILIDLSWDDINAIKAIITLATTRNDTFLTATRNTVQDKNYNLLVPHTRNEALRAFEVIPDTISPQLLRFSVNFTDGRVVLYFSESIDITTLDLREITFISQANFINSTNFTLTQGDDITSFNTPTVTFTLSVTDKNEIARLRNLCTEESDCLLTFSSALVNDTSGNSVNPITSAMPRTADPYVPDLNPTGLDFFQLLDLDDGRLTLIFEETITASSVNLTELRLDDFPATGSSTQSVQLTGGEVLSEDSTNVTIRILTEDLNRIKSTVGLCTNGITDCFIRLGADFARDTFGSTIRPVTGSSTANPNEIPLEFIQDSSPPILLYFDVDLTTNNITLVFDETIDYPTFDARQISFHSDTANASVTFKLSNRQADRSNLYSPILSFIPDPEDEVIIKALDGLATSVNDTFISFTSDLIQDRDGNNAMARDVNNALQVRNFTADSIQPDLVIFSEMDLDSGSLVLSFNEPMNINSINYSLITIHDGSADSLTLTGGSAVYESDPTTDKREIRITLNREDIRSLKLNLDLAVSTATSFVNLTEGAIKDQAGNDVLERSNLMAIRFTPDTTSPNLLNYTLDMNTGVIEMLYDDVIDPTTLDVRFIRLQGDQIGDDTESAYSLTTASVFTNSSRGDRLTLYLRQDDLNEIKMLPRLATDINNTYLALQADAIQDVSGNPVTSIVRRNARQAVSYIADSTDPYLESFVLNLDSFTIVFTFSEAVDVTSLNITQVTLQNMQSAIGSGNLEQITLSGGTPNPNFTGRIITFSLTVDDVNLLKSMTSLGTQEMNTYLYHTVEFVLDMAMNNIIPIPADNAEMVAALSSDTEPPVIVSFHLDMDGPTLFLTFQEVVNATSVLPTYFAFASTSIGEYKMIFLISVLVIYIFYSL